MIEYMKESVLRLCHSSKLLDIIYNQHIYCLIKLDKVCYFIAQSCINKLHLK